MAAPSFMRSSLPVEEQDFDAYKNNLKNTLEMSKEKGITFNLKESTVCRKEMTLFGRTF